MSDTLTIKRRGFGFDWAARWHITRSTTEGTKTMKCTICHEPIRFDGAHWTHGHGDTSCGTGDGSTAYPPATHAPLPRQEYEV